MSVSQENRALVIIYKYTTLGFLDNQDFSKKKKYIDLSICIVLCWCITHSYLDNMSSCENETRRDIYDT